MRVPCVNTPSYAGFCAAVPAADGAAPGGGLFGGFVAPQPGSSFGGFGAAAAAKPKDEEEGGDGEGDAGGDENGQELFGGPEVAPVVQLSEVPKQNGEEEESSVFTGGGRVEEGGAEACITLFQGVTWAGTDCVTAVLPKQWFVLVCVWRSGAGVAVVVEACDTVCAP